MPKSITQILCNNECEVEPYKERDKRKKLTRNRLERRDRETEQEASTCSFFTLSFSVMEVCTAVQNFHYLYFFANIRIKAHWIHSSRVLLVKSFPHF